MDIAIDILAGIVLLFFFLTGWRSGFLLSLLGAVRVIIAYGVSYFAGLHLGFWLGEVANRPRIVTIPMVAILTFVIITYIFHITMSNIRSNHKYQKENDTFRLSVFSRLCGSTLNLATGLFAIILLFWLGDLFMVGVTKHPIPGADQSHFGHFARRAVYEVSYLLIPKDGNESQAAATARVISDPAKGVTHLKTALSAPSMQRLMNDRKFAEALMSGDPNQIENNRSLQRLFKDRKTLQELRELGILSGNETKPELCEKLSRFGSNETIRASLQNLKDKDLLNKNEILLLIRDPDFDIIVAEVLR